MNYYLTSKTLKEQILEKVSEEDIFSFYLNCNISKSLKSPLRDDKNPSASFFRYKNDSLMFKDFGGFVGDCFSLVGKLYNLNYYQAIEKVYYDLINKKDMGIPKLNFVVKEHQYSKIQVEYKDFTDKALDYWNEYSIDINRLNKFNVYLCNKVYVNDELLYTYNENNLTFGYYFGNGYWKIYSPMKKERRFMSNTNNKIYQGLSLLPQNGDNLIITKSYKDVICFDLFDIPAISPQSESCKLDDRLMVNLKSRFNNIYINYDYDYTGISSMNRERKKYNLIPLYFKNKLPTKDFADYLKAFKAKTNIFLNENSKNLGSKLRW